MHTKRNYTPVQDESAHLTDKPNRPRQKARVPNQAKRGLYETPQMTKAGDAITANPVTKGDRSSSRGRYEKGRIDKSRS
jgi:hypothetical protein